SSHDSSTLVCSVGLSVSVCLSPPPASILLPYTTLFRSAADVNIKMCPFGVRFDVLRPDIIVPPDTVEPDRHIQIHVSDVFVPTVCNDTFIRLFGHVCEGIHDIINALKIIRMIKVYICNYCVIGMVA